MIQAELQALAGTTRVASPRRPARPLHTSATRAHPRRRFLPIRLYQHPQLDGRRQTLPYRRSRSPRSTSSERSLRARRGACSASRAAQLRPALRLLVLLPMRGATVASCRERTSRRIEGGRAGLCLGSTADHPRQCHGDLSTLPGRHTIAFGRDLWFARLPLLPFFSLRATFLVVLRASSSLLARIIGTEAYSHPSVSRSRVPLVAPRPHPPIHTRSAPLQRSPFLSLYGHSLRSRCIAYAVGLACLYSSVVIAFR